jgi:hypothetical protein
MLCVLLEVFGVDPVIGQLGIPRQLGVFVDNLLRRPANLALWAGTVKHAIDDISDGPIAVVIIL